MKFTMHGILLIALGNLPGASMLAQGIQDGSQGSGGDEQSTYTISVDAKWNLVSVPVRTADNSRSGLFPPSVSTAFYFEDGYVAAETLDIGRGYWLKFPVAATLPFNGLVVEAETIDVNAGWNIIGGISHPVPVVAITSIGTAFESSVFGYSNGYYIAGSVEPGRGYWMKMSSPGMLVLTSNGSAEVVARPVGEPDLERRLSSITLSKRGESGLSLYFGSGSASDRAKSQLPPPPPDGAFDVRYGSGGVIEILEPPASEQSDFPIILRGVGPTVTASFHPAEKSAVRVTIGGMELREGAPIDVPVPPSGVILMNVVHGSLVPERFALFQNYPNPFNPNTTIRYNLAKMATVSLIVFDYLGREALRLVESIPQDAGEYSVSVPVGSLASGVYFYTLSAFTEFGNFRDTKKMVVLK